MRNLSEKYFPLIEKFKSLPSGSITVEGYCWQNSINTKTFYYWKKKFEVQHRKGFLPVVIEAVPKTNNSGLVIQFTDGTRLIFESGSSAPVVKQFIPVFNK